MDDDARLTAALYPVRHRVPIRVAMTLSDIDLKRWFEVMLSINGEAFEPFDDCDERRPPLRVIDFKAARTPRDEG